MTTPAITAAAPAPAAAPASPTDLAATAALDPASSAIASTPASSAPAGGLADAGSSEFDARRFRDVMGSFPSGVTVITTRDAGGPVGFTCQSFYSVSVDPPLISFSISRTSRSLAALREHRRLVVNVLSREQQHLSAQFARSGTDKWRGVDWSPSKWNEAPVLDGVSAWVAGEIEREIEAGDHLIYLVRVGSLQTDAAREPLVFHRGAYRELEYQI